MHKSKTLLKISVILLIFLMITHKRNHSNDNEFAPRYSNMIFILLCKNFSMICFRNILAILCCTFYILFTFITGF